MTKPSVVVENVSKKFGQSLESALKYGIIDTLRRCTGLGKDEKVRKGEFWALNDVSFSLEPGDALGIMGVNGSGKTTLLRILNGTYAPDSGKVTLRGRIGALIAAGAGFSPMLTGRENVFISGALLGMSSREVRRRFDEIVAFSELEEFIDMPVRNYSSGMAVRLGFAVAVLGAPDILLVDEVLAVGDVSFQKKCFERIQSLKSNGTTILLVSHSPGAIWTVCNKGLTLHHGQSQGLCPTEKACRDYDDYNIHARAQQQNPHSNSSEHLNHEESDVSIDKFATLDSNNLPIMSTQYGDSFKLQLIITTKTQLKNAIIRVSIDSEIHKCISIIDNYESMSNFYELGPGRYLVEIVIFNPNLRPGVYSFTAAVIDKEIGIHRFLRHNIGTIAITNPESPFFYADTRAVVHINALYAVTRIPA